MPTAPLRRTWDRLRELAALEPGWLDGGGERLSRWALFRAGLRATLLELAGLPQVYLYPDEGGGVRLEWAPGDVEVYPEGGASATEHRDWPEVEPEADTDGEDPGSGGTLH